VGRTKVEPVTSCRFDNFYNVMVLGEDFEYHFFNWDEVHKEKVNANLSSKATVTSFPGLT
jgi:hypothetical protein